jgi:hypothetical protein
MFKTKQFILIIIMLSFGMRISAQKIALLKYKGGGDWYANITTSLPNLIKFANENIHTTIEKADVVTPDSPEIFNYPYIHMTGHGNVFFDDNDIENLRKYLLNGGFLHADDNYGMDPYIRREIKKLFPNKPLVELPKSHPIFHNVFQFPDGLPKIHEHNGKRPQAFGIFDDQNRLILLYTFESDLGDGWESEVIHHDPLEIREKALKMGANILYYAFTN